MKLAVIGSRGFTDYELLKSRLDDLNKIEPITLVILGGAKGTDRLVERWAKEIDIPTEIAHPDRDEGIGSIGNKGVIDHCEKVFVFWDGESRGTKYSMGLAHEQHKPVFIEIYKPV